MRRILIACKCPKNTFCEATFMDICNLSKLQSTGGQEEGETQYHMDWILIGCECPKRQFCGAIFWTFATDQNPSHIISYHIKGLPELRAPAAGDAPLEIAKMFP